MFGYVIPDKPNMFIKDFSLYRAYYCGICKCIGKEYGQIMRFATNYDITFLNALLHNVLDKQPPIASESCVLSPFKKRPIVEADEITRDVVDVNTMLVYYKLKDNIADDGGAGARIADFALVRRKYKKAAKRLAKIDEILKKGYEEQALAEKSGAGIDRAAHPFSEMLAKTVGELAGDKNDEHVYGLCYNLGKWVYIMDAADDAADDFKKKRFNPLLEGYDFKDRETFLADKREDLEFLLGTAQGAMSEHFEYLKSHVSEGVLTNVIWHGLRERSNQILGSSKKCKKIRI